MSSFKWKIIIKYMLVVILIIANISLGWIVGYYSKGIKSQERLSPADHIIIDDMFVDNNVFVLKGNYRITTFRDSNSMDPVIDSEMNGIEKIYFNETEIKAGDIIAYNFNDNIIIHRVIRIGYDKNGWFAIAKGDNNDIEDPYPVRFSQITGLLVGVLY